MAQVMPSSLLADVLTRGVGFRRERVEAAQHLAEELCKDQQHSTGVSVFEHVCDVLEVLLPFQPDEDAVIACLLHHSLDRRQVTLAELEEQFGPKVRALVSGIHLLSRVTLRGQHRSVDDLRLMLVSVSDDIRVVLIVLCDLCAILARLSALPSEEQKRICRDILSLFAPVAARLGIHSLKQRLESYAFPVVSPFDAERIEEQLAEVAERYGSFLDRAALLLQQALQEQGIAAEVQGRAKQSYSIFLKMKAKALSHVDRLHDLFALRCIVATEEECYRALGVLHRLGRPATNRFKDYIAFPKPNGYQSLHTTMARLPGVPDSVFIEVQIRTQTMHREAEHGIAAHWSYKVGGTAEQIAHRVQLDRVLAHQEAVEDGISSGGEPHAALVDHIFVLTPKGDIVELPEGATPLDFAFHIHTDLGLSFRAARVNSVIVPLDHELENGDVVEIIRHAVPRPSPEWLQLLRSAASRSRLKRYFYGQDRSRYVAEGRALVNTELRRHHLPPLDTDLTLLRLTNGTVHPMTEREDLLMKIGQGSEKAAALLPHCDLLRDALRARERTEKRPRLQRKDPLVTLEGGIDMPLRFAKCCVPQEGDRPYILGVITRSGEVVVHREQCRMCCNANPERKIGVRWRTE